MPRRDVIRDQLRLEPRAKALQSKPARALTQEEARDLTVYYALTGQITLERQITFELNGKPAFPKPIEKVTLGLEIAGVSFVPNNPAAATWQATKPLDMRLVVLLVRLSQYLNSSLWGVTIIYWGGLGSRASTRWTGMGRASRSTFMARLRAVGNMMFYGIGGPDRSRYRTESRHRTTNGR